MAGTDSFDSSFIAEEKRKEEEAKAKRIAEAEARIAALKQQVENQHAAEVPDESAAAPEKPEQQQPAPEPAATSAAPEGEIDEDPNAPEGEDQAPTDTQSPIEASIEAAELRKSREEPVEQEDDTSIFGDIGMGVVNGLRDAGVNAAQLGLDVVTLGQTDIDLNTMVPDVKDRDSVVFDLTSGFTQFGLGFVPAIGALNWLAKGAKIKGALNSVRAIGAVGRFAVNTGKGALAGAIADSAVWSPHEARLSDIIEGTPFSNPITAYLANDEDDSKFEGRMKNVLEGVGLGSILDIVVGGAARSKTIRNIFRRSITEGAANETAMAVKNELEDVVLKRQNLQEIRRARQTLQTASAQGTTNPVADKMVLGKAALEEEKRSLTEQLTAAGKDAHPDDVQFIQQQIADIDEALGHVEGAESRGLTPEEAAAPMQEHAAANAPLEQIRAKSPEAAAKIEQSAKGGQRALDEQEARAIAELQESEAALIRNMSDPESNINKLDLESRTEIDRLVADVPEEVADAVDAARKNLPDSERIAADAAERQRLLKEQQAEARASLEDGPDVFRLENGKVVMDEEGVLARIEQRKRKRIKTSQVIDMEDPVWFRAVTKIFEAAHGSVDELDMEALAMMSNINLERVAGESGGLFAVQAEISDFIATHMNITAAKEGRSLKTTQAMARKIVAQDAGIIGAPELTEKWLQNMERVYHDDLKNLDVHLTALRMLTQSAFIEARLAGRAVANKGGSESIARYVHSVQTFTRLEALREGTLTGVARALSAGRITVEAVPILRYDKKGLLTEQSAQELESMIGAFGGKEAIEKHATQLLELIDNPRGRRAFLQATLNKSGRYIRAPMEYWINAILSNPVTHAVNTLANHAVMLYLPAEQIAAGALASLGGRASRKAGMALMNDGLHKYGGLIEGYKAAFRMGRGDFITVLESLKEQYGGVAGAYEKAQYLAAGNDTMGNFWKSLMTGDGTLIPDAKQYDFHVQNALTSQHTAANLDSIGMKKAADWVDEGTTGGRIIDAMGNFVRTPGRLLTVGDEMAKTINYQMQMHSLAYRDAVENGAEDFAAHITKFKGDIPTWRTNPDIDDATRRAWEELDTTAKSYARYATFTDPLEGIAKTLQDAVQKHPWLRLVVPFVRTPANLLSFSVARTPFGAVFHPIEYTKAFAALATGKDTAEFAAKRARIMIGSGLMAVVSSAAAQGRITGSGPSNYEERQALLATGWQPNSFVLTNDDGTERYISYNRMEPFSLIFQMAASVGEMGGYFNEDELAEAGWATVVGLAEALKSKSYFTGAVEIISAINEPDRKLERVWQRYVASTVPAGVTQVNRAWNDSTMRNVNSAFDAFKARIPGLSSSLPPRRNIFGEPVTYAMGMGPDIVSPFMTRTAAGDPVNKEIRRLVSEVNFHVDMSMYKRIEDVELTPQEMDRYIVLAAGDPSRNGYDVRMALRKLMQSSKYKNAEDGDEGKKALISRLLADRRARARKAMLKENDDLRARVAEAALARHDKIKKAREQERKGKQGSFSSQLESLFGNTEQ